MRVLDLIIKKRDGFSLTDEELEFLINGYVKGEVPDYQISAFLMAVFYNDLSFDELYSLTKLMVNSGDLLDFSYIDKIKVDKHSTGGVGDKVSLIVAPIVAACGGCVPMMSGRGLGHTGGTLDKLESIPGYQVFHHSQKIKQIINECGYVMMGQTENIVVADKKLYSLRDVTGTVESIPLITSSILSKKIAEGSDALLLDLKCGKGAFMKSLADARSLADRLSRIYKMFNKNIKIKITDMDSPLGCAVGNSNEVIESIEILKGKYVRRLSELSFSIAADMIVLSQIESDYDSAYKLAVKSVESGAALECFERNVKLQGGDLNGFYENMKTKFNIEIKSRNSGYIKTLDAYKIGIASMLIGCGRKTVDDRIDHHAGISVNVNVGDYVKEGDVLFTLQSNIPDNGTAVDMLYRSLEYSENAVESPKIIIEEVV